MFFRTHWEVGEMGSNYTPPTLHLPRPEMEFLDINLTKNSMLFTVPYWRILKKTIPFSGFKKVLTRKLEYIHELHFVERKEEGRKQDKNSSLRRLEFMSRKLRLKILLKNSISGRGTSWLPRTPT
jgi:hypothetical protein